MGAALYNSGPQSPAGAGAPGRASIRAGAAGGTIAT